MSEETRHEIHLILCGDCNQHLCITRTGFYQITHPASASMNGHNVKTLANTGKWFLILIHHNNVVVLLGEKLCKIKADLAGTDNNDFHKRPFIRSSTIRPPPNSGPKWPLFRIAASAGQERLRQSRGPRQVSSPHP